MHLDAEGTAGGDVTIGTAEGAAAVVVTAGGAGREAKGAPKTTLVVDA